MKLHSDLLQNATVQTNSLIWRKSPMPGVKRQLIEREGDEVARATSLVHYDENTRFSEHVHDKGEEFLVLEGIFSDENGDYPAGTYVRNPSGSKHSPYCENGCTILVKLRQFHPEDQSVVRIDSTKAKWQKSSRKGITFLALHQFGSENVALIQSHVDTLLWDRSFEQGLEIFILSGRTESTGEINTAGAWLRIAPGQKNKLIVSKGTRLLVKTGHLPEVSLGEPLAWQELLNSQENDHE